MALPRIKPTKPMGVGNADANSVFENVFMLAPFLKLLFLGLLYLSNIEVMDFQGPLALQRDPPIIAATI